MYFEDAYRTEFEAKVLQRLEREGRPSVILDRTCFYPESGGQPWDTGTIERLPVVQVFEEGDSILHVLENDPGPSLAPGASVIGRVDWTRRFDHMQQHTGQHILSQAFIEILKGETRSFHLGADISTLEIGLGSTAEEDIVRVERLANDVVFRNLEVKTAFVPQDKIHEVPLRRPPKKEGLLRVVEVERFDYSACGGTHCRRTGEVGLIKITRWDKIRGNVRFEFLCGGRALDDYLHKNSAMRRIAGVLSVSDKDAASSVEKVAGEQRAQHKAVRALKEKLAGLEAAELLRETEGKVMRRVFADKSPEEVRLLALAVVKQSPRVTLFAVRTGVQSHIILARSEVVQLDLRELVPLINSKIGGKGGGSASLAEVVAPEGLDLEKILLEIFEQIGKNFPD